MEKNYTYEDLLDIVKTLRGEGGCPWDMEQTHQSIKHSIIEEGYELIEELDGENWEKVADESGDLLLQIVFHAQIGKENGEYDMADVINAVCRKLVHRHPHVFGDVKVKDSDEVLANWAQIKRDDRGQKTVSQDMQGVSKYLPSLMRAEKIQGKAEKGGYTVERKGLVSEVAERKLSGLNSEDAEMCIGELLFEAVSMAKAAGVDAETALSRYTEDFIKKFSEYEG